MKDLVEKYITLRDAKAQAKKKFDDKVAGLTAIMDQIEAMILDEFNRTGIEACKTEHGTAYRSVKTSATVADWETVLEYIKANDQWGMLERRVSKEAVVAFKEEHNDLPPGVNWSEMVTIGVRRA